MELPEICSILEEQLDAYYKEADAIERKLTTGVPQGKEEKLRFRLQDIEDRLIPDLNRQVNFQMRFI